MNLVDDFKKIFGDTENVIEIESPARVNIIGEHTDYNGGYVFPCALDFGTYGVARKREDNKIRLCSLTFEKIFELSLDDLSFKEEDSWTNYAKGVIVEIIKLGHNIEGFELVIDSNMPLSSGLSSSASLEVLVAVTLNELFNLEISGKDIAVLCRRAENDFMGLQCGIMDQFVIANAKENSAMLLKCSTLEYKQYNVDLLDNRFVICNTKKPRKLVESKYNERLEECQKGLDILKKYIDIDTLAELSISDFENLKKYINDEIVLNRVKHVIYETKRTLDCAKALEDKNFDEVGKLLVKSHESLRDLYEVTGFELDTMVDEALKLEGVWGARMTGAGFGGCVIALVNNKNIDEFIEKLTKAYSEKTNLQPEMYIANISGGAKVL
ncbi:MAG: galactokinase [Lachnospirales bacterium]